MWIVLAWICRQLRCSHTCSCFLLIHVEWCTCSYLMVWFVVYVKMPCTIISNITLHVSFQKSLTLSHSSDSGSPPYRCKFQAPHTSFSVHNPKKWVSWHFDLDLEFGLQGHSKVISDGAIGHRMHVYDILFVFRITYGLTRFLFKI